MRTRYRVHGIPCYTCYILLVMLVVLGRLHTCMNTYYHLHTVVNAVLTLFNRNILFGKFNSNAPPPPYSCCTYTFTITPLRAGTVVGSPFEILRVEIVSDAGIVLYFPFYPPMRFRPAGVFRW